MLREWIVPNTVHGSVLTVDLPRGDRGTAWTLAAMSAVIHHAAKHPDFVAFTREAIGLPANGLIAGQAIFRFAKQWVRFLGDPPRKELLRHPLQMAATIRAGRQAEGDCDDLAMFIAAMLRASGSTPVLIVVARSAADDFEHVYAGVLIDKTRSLPLDPQETGSPFVHPPHRRRHTVVA